MSVVPITRDAELSRSVVSPDLMLTHTAGGEIVLHALHAGSVVALGTFENVVDAWRALDELDAPERVSLAA
jgi:hypothetical protein